MKSIIGIYILLGLSSQLLSQSPSTALVDHIQIDGRIDHWRPYTEKDRKTGWHYFIGQDHQFIYLGILIPNRKDQDLIGMTGLTLWWGGRPEQKKSKGIAYPLGLPIEQQPNDPRYLDAILFDGAINLWEQIQLDTQRLYVQGKKPIDNPGFWQAKGLQAALGRTVKGEWVYEAQVPLSLLEQPQKAGKAYQIHLITGALGRPTNLRGSDAIGISGGSASNPRQISDKSSRSRQTIFDRYATYTSPTRLRLTGLKLEIPD